MADSIEWDSQLMFDRYVYDYLIKKNMHRSAEAFRVEANVTIDPAFPFAIDVNGGFLHEWWLVFYDLFMTRQAMNFENDHGSQMKVEERLGNGINIDASYYRNDQTLESLAFGPNYGMRIRDDLLPFAEWPFSGEHLASSLPSIQQQKERVTWEPEIMRSQGDLWDIVASSAYLSQKKARTCSEQCNFDSESGTKGINKALSDASELQGTSRAESEPSSNEEDGNFSASSKFHETSESIEGNPSKGGSLGRHSSHVTATSCRLNPSTRPLFGKFINPHVT